MLKKKKIGGQEGLEISFKKGRAGPKLNMFCSAPQGTGFDILFLPGDSQGTIDSPCAPKDSLTTGDRVGYPHYLETARDPLTRHVPQKMT